MYGAKNDKDAFEAADDDFFGGGGSDEDDMLNDPGFQRLANGMVINDNTEDMKKQNQAIANAGAAMALGNKNASIYDDM